MYISHLSVNREIYTNFADRDASIEEIIATDSQDGAWCGHLAIAVLQQVLSVNVHVFSVDRQPVENFLSDSAQTIELAYVGGNHYNTIGCPCVYNYFFLNIFLHLDKYYLVPTSDYRRPSDDDEEPFLDDDAHIPSATQELSPRSLGEKTPFTITSLLQSHLLTEESAERWLMKMGVFKKPQCPRCLIDMRYRVNYGSSARRSQWICKCGKRQGVPIGTIFEDSRIPIHISLQIMLRWLRNEKITDIITETQCSHTTVERWIERLRLFAAHVMKTRQELIGGPGRVVEIDEVNIKRRKGGKGRLKESGWVLGGVERPEYIGERPRMFMCTIDRKDSSTILNQIRKFVRKGTLIVTDGLASYNVLSDAGYIHAVVNHEEHFVQPGCEAHTQRVENLWHWLRKDGFSNRGATLEMIDIYCQSFMYRRCIGKDIQQFILDLAVVNKDMFDNLQIKWSTIRAREREIRRKRENISSRIEPKTPRANKKVDETKRKRKQYNLHLSESARTLLKKRPQQKPLGEARREQVQKPENLSTDTIGNDAESTWDNEFDDCSLQDLSEEESNSSRTSPVPLKRYFPRPRSTKPESYDEPLGRKMLKLIDDDVSTSDDCDSFDVFNHISASQEYRSELLDKRAKTMKSPVPAEVCAETKQEKEVPEYVIRTRAQLAAMGPK